MNYLIRKAIIWFCLFLIIVSTILSVIESIRMEKYGYEKFSGRKISWVRYLFVKD
jgi:hypothetical protein